MVHVPVYNLVCDMQWLKGTTIKLFYARATFPVYQ